MSEITEVISESDSDVQHEEIDQDALRRAAVKDLYREERFKRSSRVSVLGNGDFTLRPWSDSNSRVFSHTTSRHLM